jgi:hypothetical protein
LILHLADQRRILDTGDDPQAAATIGTGLDVDGEDALQALRPGHGCHGFSAAHRVSRPLRHDAFSVFEIRCIDRTVETAILAPAKCSLHRKLTIPSLRIGCIGLHKPVQFFRENVLVDKPPKDAITPNKHQG